MHSLSRKKRNSTLSLSLLLDILPTAAFQGVMKNLLTEKDSVGWETSWVVRYSVVVKSRGIIKGKGYIVKGKRNLGKSP